MELREELVPVIADMEYLIGKECYNPNSYDGWNDIEGRSFRYPVSIRTEAGKFIKPKVELEYALAYHKEIKNVPEALTYMKYKFGSNELFIGKGLLNILEYLEKRYNLDFVEMEKHRNM